MRQRDAVASVVTAPSPQIAALQLDSLGVKAATGARRRTRFESGDGDFVEQVRDVNHEPGELPRNPGQRRLATERDRRNNAVTISLLSHQ